MLANFCRLEEHSTKGWPFWVRDNDGAKMSRVNFECVKKKSLVKIEKLWSVREVR